MSDEDICPQCGGKVIDAPSVVYWHKNCQRCKTTWLINNRGTWEAVNSKIKIKYRRASVAKRQREFGEKR